MKILLFTISCLILISGFLIERADRWLWVMKVIAPDYSRGVLILDSLLENDGTINSGEKGFDEIADLFRSDIKIEGNPNLIPSISITEIRFEGAGIDLSSGNAFKNITLILQNREPLSGHFNVVSLKEHFKKTYFENSFAKYSDWIFVFGLSLSILSFCYDSKKPERS